ncbi:MAG: hypothetical protein CMH97_10435 [Oceanospirillaceae bacterium]|nr:hypothetical protein [Oceanospirillaceae bacterium]
MEVTVDFEVGVSILFGLEVNVKAIVAAVVEVFMEISFVVNTSVWCGVAFLRAKLGHFQPKREVSTDLLSALSRKNERGCKSSSPHYEFQAFCAEYALPASISPVVGAFEEVA